jgi:hypothetical protein
MDRRGISSGAAAPKFHIRGQPGTANGADDNASGKNHRNFEPYGRRRHSRRGGPEQKQRRAKGDENAEKRPHHRLGTPSTPPGPYSPSTPEAGTIVARTQKPSSSDKDGLATIIGSRQDRVVKPHFIAAALLLGAGLGALAAGLPLLM